MHKVEINNTTYQLPGEWDDLTFDHLLFLVRLTSKDTPIEEIKIQMMLYCLSAHVCRHRKRYRDHVKISIGRFSRHNYLLSPEYVSALADCFSFLFKKVEMSSGEYKYMISPLLTTNPLKELTIGTHRFYGADDGLMDVNYEQFVLLQYYHQRMQQEPEYIHQLLAVLFHREKEFDPDKVESDAKILRNLKQQKKLILYWFYLGCISWLASHFPRVFSGGGSTSGNIYEAQLRVIDSLANNDMTKKPAVRKGLLYDALMTMEESVRKQEELEEKQNK